MLSHKETMASPSGGGKHMIYKDVLLCNFSDTVALGATVLLALCRYDHYTVSSFLYNEDKFVLIVQMPTELGPWGNRS